MAAILFWTIRKLNTSGFQTPTVFGFRRNSLNVKPKGINKFFLISPGGVPKVGQLLNSAWSLNDTCRFKILQPPKKPKLPELPKASKDKQKEDYDSASMPPPPSPASSTCSDGSLSSPGKTSSYVIYNRSFYSSMA